LTQLRLSKFVTAVLLLLAPTLSFAATVAFPPGDDQVLHWEQSPDAATLIGTGYLGNRFVRLQDGGSVATYITVSALANAVYGMTAAIARFSPSANWTLEVFAGGIPTLGSGVPAGSILLLTTSGTVPVDSTEDAPNWLARGTDHSVVSGAPAAGAAVWGRIRASGGSLGVDSVLGVENLSAYWYPGQDPARTDNLTNWDFELNPLQDETPEPSTLALFGTGCLVFLTLRRRSVKR
jgi:hypothetical protein